MVVFMPPHIMCGHSHTCPLSKHSVPVQVTVQNPYDFALENVCASVHAPTLQTDAVQECVKLRAGEGRVLALNVAVSSGANADLEGRHTIIAKVLQGLTVVTPGLQGGTHLFLLFPRVAPDTSVPCYSLGLRARCSVQTDASVCMHGLAPPCSSPARFILCAQMICTPAYSPLSPSAWVCSRP